MKLDEMSLEESLGLSGEQADAEVDEDTEAGGFVLTV